ncbi:cytochrome c3 family protein [Desulfohalovibrio reitneri]|uniref:cytochrome c3 family protein n=1 Tax=Desulfohalovibrio reitneri TaxID=1307759 RepID=UPI0004A6F7A7|nr:cytochrome c3 family protein [Desulfohalovibrio reitneri]
MRKLLFVCLTCAAVLGLFALPAVYAVDAPEDMMVTVPEGAEKTQAPVGFSHKRPGHAEYDCQTCHHTWDGQGEIKSCSAEGCHTDMKARKGGGSFYAAFHDRKNEASCVGCHSKEGKGPKICTECHPRD